MYVLIENICLGIEFIENLYDFGIFSRFLVWTSIRMHIVWMVNGVVTASEDEH